MLKQLLLCLALLLHNVISETSSRGANETDHLSLMAIKSQITLDPQGVLDTWNDSLHFCQWEGVTCGRKHRRVTELDLSSQGLVGTLSPSVGNLSFLRFFSLSSNTFEGVIPPEIGHLSRLRFLHLANNSLQGEIPSSISNCTDMRELSLGGNKITGKLPSELSSLVELTDLIVQRNNITGAIPVNIGNLTSLQQFFASHNPLGGTIPGSFGNLRNLQILGLAELELSGTIPSSFYNLSSLLILDLSLNQLGGKLPLDIGLKLHRMQHLRIWMNQFSGPLPPSISNWSDLIRLDLSYNKFSGKIGFSFGKLPNLESILLYENTIGSGEVDDMNLINSMVNCSKLQQLDLGATQIRGMLPNSIGNLSTQLLRLHLGENFIYGPIPSTIGNLVGLELLILQNSQFTGPIPSTLGNLFKLQRLYLQNNYFTGGIPKSIGNLSVANLINLFNNSLEQTIPSEIGHCQSLTYLSLSANHLNGRIPEKLFELSSLSMSLDLSQNQLVGPLPKEIGNLKNIMTLDLSNNHLDGEIPNSISSCLSLRYVYLQRNMFHGSLPPSFSSLRGIQSLDLSVNNFSGRIPHFLEQFNLSYLNLSFNKFEGEVPMEGVFTNTSAVAISSNGMLCGGVPELQLPKCLPIKLKKQKRLPVSIIVVISICSLLAFLAMASFLLFCCWGRKRQAQPTEARDMQSLSRVSYGSLFKATDGFSEMNLIGTGSCSSVYKGITEPDQKVIAVKVLHLGNQGASKSFLAECEVLRNTRHRNLLKIITTCSSTDFQRNEFKALVYEYMPNGNLDKWLHPGPETKIYDTNSQKLNFLQRIVIAIDVAQAVHYLHQGCEKPIVHCDLKPTNILLDEDMIAHVGDFGIAKFLPLEPSNTNHSSSAGFRGTIGYAAPEYGLGSEISREGDVYSFGILLLEMMTGKRPTDSMFQGLNLHSYVKTALAHDMIAIVEPTLLDTNKYDEKDEEKACKVNEEKSWNKIEECVISWATIGVACSVESPKDRMVLSKAIEELLRIKGVLVC
nr:receptor kinase-like protein Xa21 [Tanacetum cinerariifolium]